MVPAVVGKSDSYAELPWTAFALGSSLAAFALVVGDAWRPHWTVSATALLHALAILGAGAASALAAVFIPPYARLFLRSIRSAAEVRQYAESLFLRHRLYATRRRTCILILVSLFERRIEILADAGCNDRITAAEWDVVMARMAPLLRDRRPGAALSAAIDAVEALLLSKGFAGADGDSDEISNRPIEERGE